MHAQGCPGSLSGITCLIDSLQVLNSSLAQVAPRFDQVASHILCYVYFRTTTSIVDRIHKHHITKEYRTSALKESLSLQSWVSTTISIEVTADVFVPGNHFLKQNWYVPVELCWSYPGRSPRHIQTGDTKLPSPGEERVPKHWKPQPGDTIGPSTGEKRLHSQWKPQPQGTSAK